MVRCIDVKYSFILNIQNEAKIWFTQKSVS